MKKTLVLLVTGIFSVLLSGFAGLHTSPARLGLPHQSRSEIVPPPSGGGIASAFGLAMTAKNFPTSPARRHSFLTQLEKDWQAQRFFAASA